jgi:hypothetical protein
LLAGLSAGGLEGAAVALGVGLGLIWPSVPCSEFAYMAAAAAVTAIIMITTTTIIIANLLSSTHFTCLLFQELHENSEKEI